MEGTMSEIRMFAGNFAPRNWAMCNGQLLPINQNQALFSLIGTTYGGDGVTNFALPKFDARIAMGTGSVPGSYQLGEVNGTESVTLTLGQMPAHIHMGTLPTSVPTYADNGDSAVPTGANLAAVPGMYAAPSAANTTLKPFTASVTTQMTGASQPINIMQPYLAMNYVICLYGVYPSRP